MLHVKYITPKTIRTTGSSSILLAKIAVPIEPQLITVAVSLITLFFYKDHPPICLLPTAHIHRDDSP